MCVRVCGFGEAEGENVWVLKGFMTEKCEDADRMAFVCVCVCVRVGVCVCGSICVFDCVCLCVEN